MPKTSRYYYKRYLTEAADHLYICHQRLMAASVLLEQGNYAAHVAFIQEFDKQLFAMMENLKQYEATI